MSRRCHRSDDFERAHSEPKPVSMRDCQLIQTACAKWSAERGQKAMGFRQMITASVNEAKSRKQNER